MFGKHYASMYTGSMIGKGSAVFAVWGYVIAMAKPPTFEVELNPRLLAFVIGEAEEKIKEAIVVLCSPDSSSRTKVEDGRRLIRRGEFMYYVVNGKTYYEMKLMEDRKAVWRADKVEQRMASKVPQERLDLAERIYNEYPKKIGKKRAMLVISKCLEEVSFDVLLEKTRLYAKARAGQDSQYTPHPATWYAQGRYEDDPAAWLPKPWNPSSLGSTPKLTHESEISRFI